MREDKEKARKAAYYAANRDKEKARTAAYRDANKEKVKGFNTAWYADHREDKLAYMKAHRAEHREDRLAYEKAHRAERKEEILANNRGRRALLKGAEGTHTAADVKAIYEKQEGKCYWCGVKVGKEYHVDHFMPLSKGGSNWPENLVIACKTCNLRKGSKTPDEWMNEKE